MKAIEYSFAESSRSNVEDSQEDDDGESDSESVMKSTVLLMKSRNRRMSN